jgi:hypothetical protein
MMPSLIAKVPYLILWLKSLAIRLGVYKSVNRFTLVIFVFKRVTSVNRFTLFGLIEVIPTTPKRPTRSRHSYSDCKHVSDFPVT